MPSDTCTTTVYVVGDRYSPPGHRACGREIGPVGDYTPPDVHRCIVCGDATCERHAFGHEPGRIACRRCWRALMALADRMGPDERASAFARWPRELLDLIACEASIGSPMRWRLVLQTYDALLGDQARQPPELPDRLPDLEADLAAGVVRPLPAPRPLPSWMRCSST